MILDWIKKKIQNPMKKKILKKLGELDYRLY